MIQPNCIITGSCPSILKEITDETIDLIVTSPPYDKMRNYNSDFDFENIAAELYRILKIGGVMVWIAGDSTKNGSESLTSFKQVIFFQDSCGFLLHDTMIYGKVNPIPLNHNRYEQQFEYMFVLGKGKPKTFNPIKIPVKSRKQRIDHHHNRNYMRGNTLRGHNETKIKGNIWFYKIGYMQSSKDLEAFKHPAVFPEDLARDHILSWSNPGDLILDPFCGSGTTCKMALMNGRQYIGIDIDQGYVEIANHRIDLASKNKAKKPSKNNF